MKRIIANVSATLVAAWLEQHKFPTRIEDQKIGSAIGKKQDTVRRALKELRNLGAISYTEQDIRNRTVSYNAYHWLWIAVAQESAK